MAVSKIPQKIKVVTKTVTSGAAGTAELFNTRKIILAIEGAQTDYLNVTPYFYLGTTCGNFFNITSATPQKRANYTATLTIWYMDYPN